MNKDIPQYPISDNRPGQIITFYSYKGGTGRSMALANIGCLLAQRQSEGKGVLLVDWDLEAPGLHRFFRDRVRGPFKDAAAADRALDLQPGLIDLFCELYAATASHDAADDEQDEDAARELIAGIELEKYILRTDVPSLYLLKAGRFDDAYAKHVNTFQWENLYNRSPWLIRAFADKLAQQFQYVLLDSRTGLTDISGICTMLLPEKLVVVFTPNRQSLLGVEELIRRATKYRRSSEDLRPLIVFPLPSRIETSEPGQLEIWRKSTSDDIPGYQPLFKNLFQDIYQLSECNLDPYFNEVQIQHAAAYAYGEKIAVLMEQTENRLGLPRSYETLAQWLVNRPVPWEVAEVVNEEAPADAYIKTANKVFSQFKADEQEQVKRLLTRLVRLTGPKESGDDSRLRLGVSEVDMIERTILEAMSNARLVTLQADESLGEEAIEIADDALIRKWPRLRNWISEDRDFLLWRQQLHKDVEKWENSGMDEGALLRSVPLTEAEEWLHKRPADLSTSEKQYIEKSVKLRNREQFEREQSQKEKLEQQRYQRFARWAAVAVVITILIFAIFSIRQFLRPNEQQRKEVASRQLAQASILGAVSSSPDTERNLLLALEAYRAADTPEAENALKVALFKSAGAKNEGLLLEGHTGAVNEAVFSPDGKWVATASADESARIWATASGNLLRELKGHNNPVLSIVCSSDSRFVVTSSSNNESGVGRIWDATNGDTIAILSGHKSRVNDAEFDPTGAAVLTASSDTTARLWVEATSSFSFLPSRTDPAAVGAEQAAFVNVSFNPRNDKPSRANSDQSSRPSFGKVIPRRRLATRPIQTSPPAPSKWTYLEFSGHKGPVLSAQFSPNGMQIVTASADHTARVWNGQTGQALLTLSGHTDIVKSASFSPDGKLIVTISADKTARIWDAGSGKPLVEYRGHTGDLNSAAFSYNGRLVVTASDDQTAQVWEAATGKEMVTLQGHTGQVKSAEFDREGKWVVTASTDGTARVWEVKTGRELGQLSGHQAAVNSARFSADGKLVVTASADKTARIYNCEAYLPIEDLRALACSRLKRNLTRAEWKQYLADEPYRKTCSDLP